VPSELLDIIINNTIGLSPAAPGALRCLLRVQHEDIPDDQIETLLSKPLQSIVAGALIAGEIRSRSGRSMLSARCPGYRHKQISSLQVAEVPYRK
jgi:hypothetical protein